MLHHFLSRCWLRRIHLLLGRKELVAYTLAERRCRVPITNRGKNEKDSSRNIRFGNAASFAAAEVSVSAAGAGVISGKSPPETVLETWAPVLGHGSGLVLI